MDAAARAARLSLMAFDVDGVLTDGSLFFGGGEEIKAFSSRDGHGLKMLAQAGVQLAIITGRRSQAVEARALNLGIRHLYQAVDDKRRCLLDLARNLQLDVLACGYMGDDVVDLPVLRCCGFAATVADAPPLVRRHAHYVAASQAGRGAVREVCEFIMNSSGKLDALLATYLQ